MQVNIFTPQVTPGILVQDSIICIGQSTTLTAEGLTNQTWNNGATTTQITVAPQTTTTYSIEGLNSIGCISSLSSTIVVTPLPVISASADTGVCRGASFQLTSNGGITYAWTPNVGLNNAGIANPLAWIDSTITYTVNVTDTNNCSSTEQVTITALLPPDAGFTSDIFCLNDTTVFTTSVPSLNSTFSWNFGDGSTSSAINPQHAFASPGNYNVSQLVTNSFGCIDSAQRVVTIHALPPDPLLSFQSPVCSGNQLLVQTSSSGNYSYAWTGPGNFTANTQNLTRDEANISYSGVYALQITDTLTGCRSNTISDRVTVVETPQPPLIEATTKICVGDSLLLGTSSSAYTYLWQGPAGFTTSMQHHKFLISDANELGIYTLLISSIYGCTASNSVQINLDCDVLEVFIPNVFTPNGDGKNELIEIRENGLQEFQLEIYDRWGRKVYTGTSASQGWDGKVPGGAEAIAGTYYYLLTATNLQGNTFTQNGYITLLK